MISVIRGLNALIIISQNCPDFYSLGSFSWCDEEGKKEALSRTAGGSPTGTQLSEAGEEAAVSSKVAGEPEALLL